MKYLSDFLFTLVIVALFIAIYHAWVILPMMTKVSHSQKVYVLDLDAVIKAERDKGVVRMLNGEKVDPSEVTEAVRRKISAALKTLPGNALVLDSKCVLEGGTPIAPGN